MGVEIFKINAPTYKVFTALLYQSGGEYETLYQSDESLQIGQTYFINNNIVGADFLNVGAPNNNDGTFFIATGTTPTTWGTGTPEDTLSYFTGTPIVTILENTLGYLWVHYNGVGVYEINSNDLFTGKTIVITPTTQFIENSESLYNTTIDLGNSNYIYMKNYFNFIETDGFWSPIPIEIRVYN
jgi:hypothetical protein